MDQIVKSYNCDFESIYVPLDESERAEFETALRFALITGGREIFKQGKLALELNAVPLQDLVSGQCLFLVKKCSPAVEEEKVEFAAKWCLGPESKVLFRNQAAFELEQKYGAEFRDFLRIQSGLLQPGKNNQASFHFNDSVIQVKAVSCERPELRVLEADEQTFSPNESKERHFLPTALESDFSLGLFFTKENGEIIHVNKTFARYFGYASPEEMTERVPFIQQVYRDASRREPFIELLKSKGQIELIDGEFVHADGSCFRLSGLISGKVNEKTNEFEIQGAVLRSDDRSVAEHIIQPYINLFESLPDGVAIVDLRGSIVFANEPLLTLFGVNTSELVGSQLDKLFGHYEQKDVDADESMVRRIIDKTLRDGSHRDRYTFVSARGIKVVVSVSCSVVRNVAGISSGIVMLVRDVTVKAQEQRQLLVAKQRADEANKLKESVLSNLSHETRTPLTSIIGFSSILCEYMGSADAEMKDFADNIMKSAKQLLDIINNLLLLAENQLQQTKYPLADTDISEMIKGLIPGFEKDARDSGLAFRVEAQKKLRAYTSLSAVEKIIQIFASNAIKFTEQGYVAIHAGKLNDSYIYIDVADTGVGIRDDMIDQIFEPFTQESFGNSREFPGAGLGLSVCKKLAAIIDAEISVQSEKGKGSVFRLLLPAENQKQD